ncbi:hypothetical protein EBH_0046650 [Eimeria brunetti]|uniref:Uncharacterized protein n=1 Tax=Eimeria brunetti TaxID=51314 RepID=U6LP05_9EIME|nr:hypothetical protein EBH_0046650 [Eimeria brunetti]
MEKVKRKRLKAEDGDGEEEEQQQQQKKKKKQQQQQQEQQQEKQQEQQQQQQQEQQQQQQQRKRDKATKLKRQAEAALQRVAAFPQKRIDELQQTLGGGLGKTLETLNPNEGEEKDEEEVEQQQQQQQQKQQQKQQKKAKMHAAEQLQQQSLSDFSSSIAALLEGEETVNINKLRKEEDREKEKQAALKKQILAVGIERKKEIHFEYYQAKWTLKTKQPSKGSQPKALCVS